jgi:hypothetical protein
MAVRDVNKNKRERGLYVSALSAIVLLGCIAVISLVRWSLKDHDPFVSDDADPSVIEANGEIELPPSAHDIYAHTEGFRAISIQVRFAMDATELSHFLDSTLCSEPLTGADPALQRESSLPWWRPMNAQDLWECSGKGGHSYQRILIDMSDPTTYIVYVSTSTG